MEKKIKILVAVIVVVIVVIAAVYFLVIQKDEDENGNGEENQPPLADFTYTPTEIYANQTVTFDASDSTDPDEDELTFSWNFGDPNATTSNPNTGNAVTESHIYTMPGEYQVKLVVDDGKEGGTDEVTENLTVLPEETPTVSFYPTKPDNVATNIVWKLAVNNVDGTDEQLAFENIRYNFYNGSNTDDVKLTGLVSGLSETNKNPLNPYNDDGVYFDDLDSNSVLSIGDFFSIAGDGGTTPPIQAGDNFQLIYEPNGLPMMDPIALQ